MEIENQVCSLELAKKLKELGVRQDSYWMWTKYSFWKKPQVWQSDIMRSVTITCLSGKREFAFSAYTVAELGEMLPSRFVSWFDKHWCSYGRKDSKLALQGKDVGKIHRADTEANARAKMLVYLIENNLIKLNTTQ